VIVCRKCSRRHPDGTEFCACGAFLEFDGERVAEPNAPAASSAPTSLAPPTPTSTPTSTRQTPAEPAPWSGFDGGREERAPDIGVAAVLPDTPTQPVATEPVWVEPTARAGDVPCRQCGTPNGPDRNFCRHCGASLTGLVEAGPTKETKVPWWRRWSRKAKAKAARTDPRTLASQAHSLTRGGMARRSMLFRGGGIVILLGGLLAFLGPWRGTVINRGREALGASRFEAIDVSADEVVAVPADPPIVAVPIELQGPENVVDRFANTAWATRWLDSASPGFEEAPDQEGCQPEPMTDMSLRFQFTEPTDLARIRILAGRPADDPSAQLFRAPRVLEMSVDEGPCSYLVLEGGGELEIHDFEHDDVSTVDLRIVGVTEPSEPTETVEISEIVFDR
jgi:hypothetical protein